MNTSGQGFSDMNIKANHNLTWHCEATSVTGLSPDSTH